MATPRKSDDRSVSRTYRAAVRIGEDFITVEETVTLPIDASDDEVMQAIDLGLRIYTAQRTAVESQISAIRESAVPAPIIVRDPESPASEKQRNYIAALQEDLTWSNEQLGGYAGEQDVDLVTMTKGQASSFIDGLKKLAEERPTYGERRPQPQNGQPRPQQRPSDAQPAQQRQLQALDKLAQQQGLDLEAEAQRRFNTAAQGMTYDQAASLLTELQAGQRRRAPAGELPF
ncbi:MAG: hypothetical protein H7Z42_22560 [Roseiflexaceae bacterium]|nr:hypothetical protein [Roseiflexaceae bacterium]